MIFFDKKKVAQVIASKRHKDGSISSAPMKAELPTRDADGTVDGRHSAAQDVIAALSEKSPQKLAESLAAFQDIHAMTQTKEG